jgi:hypothetical protein
MLFAGVGLYAVLCRLRGTSPAASAPFRWSNARLALGGALGAALLAIAFPELWS